METEIRMPPRRVAQLRVQLHRKAPPPTGVPTVIDSDLFMEVEFYFRTHGTYLVDEAVNLIFGGHPISPGLGTL